MKPENRRLLNCLDESVAGTAMTQTTPGRIAGAPVFLPGGIVAFATDVVVIHPAASIKPALDDTYDALWKPRGISDFHKAMLFVPVVAATPIVFISDWAARSLFPIGG
jgi:hypothetical protein